MRKNVKNMWYVYFDENLEKRIIVEEFEASTKSEAEKYFLKYKNTSNDETKDLWKLENRKTEWWRVYSVNNGNEKTEYVYTAKNRDEAYDIYSKFVKNNKLRYKEYFTNAFNILTKDKNYKYTARHMFSCHDDIQKNDKSISEFRKGYKEGKSEVEYKYTKEIPYFAKTGHSMNEWYDISHHILGDLMFNIPILLKKMNGYPLEYVNKAASKLKVKLDENCNVEDESKEHIVSETAMNMWKEEIGSFLLHLRLFSYYSDHGIVDKNDKEMVKIDKEYCDTIPYFVGSMDIDYRKLEKMILVEWDYVSNWMKKNLLKLWD